MRGGGVGKKLELIGGGAPKSSPPKNAPAKFEQRKQEEEPKKKEVEKKTIEDENQYAEEEFEEEIDEEIQSEDDNLGESQNVQQNPNRLTESGGITASQSLGVDPSVDSMVLEEYDHIEPVERLR